MDQLNSLSDFLSATDSISPWRLLFQALKILYSISFIVLPPLLVTAAWRLWVTYKQSQFIQSQKSTLLEIRLPLEVLKSPIAMEIFFMSLYQTGGEGTWIDRYVKGKTRPWFSLEIVSLEGTVKFFIWTRPSWKNYIESQIYAQFPGIEVREVSDYTLPVKYDKEKVVLWGCEFKLNKPDPFPIRTYIDYGMGGGPGGGSMGVPNVPNTAHVTDPISPVIEFLGSLGPGEQAWIQILIRAHKKDRKKPGSWFSRTDWKDDFKREVDKIRAKEKEGGKLSKADNEAIDAMEKSVSKFPFETGIRALYIASKESFNSINISGLTGSFRQYNSNNLNGFAPTRGLTIFSYPWQDYKNIRQESVKRKLLDAYKRRSYFLPPYKTQHFILNTEELATIYHFPGSTVQTPTLSRVTSKKGQPPADLPV